jgi:hypothetical protein
LKARQPTGGGGRGLKSRSHVNRRDSFFTRQGAFLFDGVSEADILRSACFRAF